ncbi:MAG: preprotein translocase subunit SecE [Candidatus Hydrogenedentes bacterium]|nr:preprotein translocase subunit SecE [Candidatus Hydrogenedentota bacterium]
MAKPPAATPIDKPSPIARARTFYSEVRAEMDKVAWPALDEIKSSTSVVLILLGMVSAMIYVFDGVFQFIVIQVLRLG